MRVALVHYSTPPVIGGVEQVLGAHARLFAAHGHEVTRISFRGDAEAGIEAGDSAEALRDRLAPVLSGMDVVFVHNVMTMPFHLGLTEALARLARELPETRFLAWVHDIAAANPDLAPVSPLLQAAADGFEYVAVSALRARQFREVTGETARVVPNGIDPARVLGLPPAVAEFADRLRLFREGLVLLHPTRLLRRKNVELGLEMMTHLRDAGAVLLITGAEDPHNAASREYARWLRAEQRRLELEEQVVFVADHFAIGDLELAGLYRLADALFLPSRQEGFGLPVLETALHRLPAFISEIEPLNEIAGGNCWRFALGTPAEEVARMIQKELAGHPETVARKRALESSWERIYERHLGPLLSGE